MTSKICPAYPQSDSVNVKGDLCPPSSLDYDRLLQYRISRVRDLLNEKSIDLAVISNPTNLRYTVDYDLYAPFQARMQNAYLFVPAEGDIILHGGFSADLKLVSESRPAARLNPFFGAPEILDGEVQMFGDQVVDFLSEIGSTDKRIALDTFSTLVTQHLLQRGVTCVDTAFTLELARQVKSSDEIVAIEYAIAVAENGIRRMVGHLREGISENELYSILAQYNLAHGGLYTEGKSLVSGSRTNPWLQQSSDRAISDGELLAFDTDMIGPFGYCADVSRTVLCGDRRPSGEQKELYQRAFDEVHFNMELVKPGLTFSELSKMAFRQPDDLVSQRYVCLAHGVGMCDEYPKIAYKQDWGRIGYDGVIVPGMVICIESYCGRVGGSEGVKLEEQVLVTENGYRVLSKYPFESEFLT